MPTWESILEQYLEGAASRASAESLRFRIALPPEARREVETVLRLTDRLTDASRSVASPEGAAPRLADRLHRAGMPETMPKWVNRGGEFFAPDGAAPAAADEDAVNAAIEGVPEMGGTTRTAPAGGLGGEHHRDGIAFDKIAAAARREASALPAPVPRGALGRLRARLAEARNRGEGPSPTAARRIIAQLRGEAPVLPPAVVRPPDVLAAGNEPPDADQLPDQPSDI